MDDDLINTFWDRVKRTYNPKWNILDLARGDIRKTIFRGSNPYGRFLHTEKRMDGLHTVLWIRKADIDEWRESGGVAELRQRIGEVFSDDDGRKLFPDIHQRADEIKEQRKQAAREKKHSKMREE